MNIEKPQTLINFISFTTSYSSYLHCGKLLYFFIWTHGEQDRQTFPRSVNKFYTESIEKKALHFLTLKVTSAKKQ